MSTKNSVMYVEMINISCLVLSSKIKQKLLKSKAIVLKLEQKKKGHHSPTLNIFRSPLTQICFFIDFSVIDRHYKP